MRHYIVTEMIRPRASRVAVVAQGELTWQHAGPERSGEPILSADHATSADNGIRYPLEILYHGVKCGCK